jgi:hypothetical protein
MRIWPVAVLMGLAVPVVLASGVSGQATIEGPTLSITRAGLTAEASPGSFCVDPPGFCADAAYPLPVRGRLPVRPGGRVVLEPSVDASKLSVRLLRVPARRIMPVGRQLTVRRLAPKRWAVTLPRRLRDATVLDVFMRWDNPRDGSGDASFWGGIRQLCR